MPRRKTHTDKWWDAAPTHILRCTGHNKTDGSRCRAEAAPGTTVCDRHGALIPSVQAAAARRVQMSVDEAARFLIDWMNDPSVDMRERVKIAHDLLDRGGLGATSKHLIGVVSDDPVETLFRDLLADPNGTYDPATVPRAELPVYDAAQAALDGAEAAPSSPTDAFPDADVVDAEIVEDAPERPHTVPGTSRENPPAWLRRDLERLL